MKTKNLIKISFLLLSLGACFSCSKKEKVVINTLSDLKNYSLKIGMPSDYDVKPELNELCSDYEPSYIDDVKMGIDSVESGKLDAYVCGEDVFKAIARENALGTLKVLEEPIKTYQIGLGLSENAPIENYKQRTDEFVQEILSNGVIEDMRQRWFTDQNYEMPEITLPSNPTYTLNAVTFGGTKPYSFLKDNKLVGFDAEMAYRLAQYLNLGLHLERAEYPSMFMGLQMGTYDLISANLYLSEEHEENMTYSIPYTQNNISIAVRDYTKVEEKTSLFEDIKTGFNKTFIQENRWKTVLSGLGITLIITFFGFALGNILGAIFCYFSLSKHKTLNILEDIYSKLMQGLPIVVILMVLFYIIFGKTSISGVYIAIVGFGLTSGSSLAIQFKSAVTSVSKEQKEAGLALGLTPIQTFLGVVFPQGIRRILPGYFAQLIATLKATSVVGYIAVTDLTKAGDLIRSATYEAFFSLFSIALIYFIISFLLITLLKYIQKRLLPKRVNVDKARGGNQ